jgi:hypothetical protein
LKPRSVGGGIDRIRAERYCRQFADGTHCETLRSLSRGDRFTGRGGNRRASGADREVGKEAGFRTKSIAPRRAARSRCARWALRAWRVALIALSMAAGGCWFGPKSLEFSHGKYNRAVQQVEDEQLLLNIIRLRYNDNPVELDVSSIAAQYELNGSVEARPFFSTEGVNLNPPVGPFGTFTSILPFAGISSTNRPTISLTPLNDPDSIRSLMSQSTLDSIIFLSETSWPVSAVFRLLVESMNHVPNAPSGSGPDMGLGTEFREYRRAMDLLQHLQDGNHIRFLREEKITEIGSPLPADAVTAASQIEAAKEKLEYQQRPDKTWVLIRRDRKLILRIDPKIADSPELAELRALLNLAPDRLEYDIVVGGAESFDRINPFVPLTKIQIAPRSVLQALYFLAHGVIVPPDHFACGLVKPTFDVVGQPYDWNEVLDKLFTVNISCTHCRPPCAYVSIKYRGVWYYIDDRDIESKTTFTFMLAMLRLNLPGTRKGGPTLTLPVGR